MGNRTKGQVSHLEFKLLPKIYGKRTRTWAVLANGSYIGSMRWHSQWRRYCFFPGHGSLYDAMCLSELGEFCEAQTIDRQAARRKELADAKD